MWKTIRGLFPEQDGNAYLLYHTTKLLYFSFFPTCVHVDTRWAHRCVEGFLNLRALHKALLSPQVLQAAWLYGEELVGLCMPLW